MGSRCHIRLSAAQLKSIFKICALFSLLQPKKKLGSMKPSLKVDGFGQTHRICANATTTYLVAYKRIKNVIS